MKRTILLFLAIAFCSLAQAKIWRVNNNTGVAADFTDLPAAVAAASAGDTIHLEASASSYSNIILTKRLVIIGPGYFFTDATPNPKTEFNTNVSSVSGITFNAGSEKSVVQGLSISSPYINADNIVLQRNDIGSYVYLAQSANCSTDTIRQNFIYGLVSSNATYTASNLMVYNNIFSGPPVQFSNVNQTTAYFINNLFVGGYTIQSANCTYQNNIMAGNSFGSYQSSNIFFNNISNSNSLPSGNGNQNSVNFSNVFVGWSSGTGYSSDGRYVLKGGSPAIGAGSINGTTVDDGPFGGPAPYVLSGMPPVPSIYALTVPSSVTYGTTTINVSVSATTAH